MRMGILMTRGLNGGVSCKGGVSRISRSNCGSGIIFNGWNRIDVLDLRKDTAERI